MAKLSPGQILTLARAAGFSSTRRVKGIPEDRMAVAISLGESGGNPQAHNALPPDDSYGLWQINMLGSLGPARRKQFGITTNEELFNPAVNVRAAKIVFDEANGFRPWSVYTSGSWMRHRAAAMNAKPEGNLPDTGMPEGGADEPWWTAFLEMNPLWGWTPGGISGPVDVIGDGLDDVLGPIQAIGDAFSFITDPENWKRVALFVAGGVVLVAGIVAVMQNLGAGKAVSNVASKVPTGKLAAGAIKRVT